VVTLSQEDFENKWKGRMLYRELRRYMNAQGIRTKEMDDADRHLKRLQYLSYFGFPVKYRNYIIKI
jgi:hypothetical protein